MTYSKTRNNLAEETQSIVFLRFFSFLAVAVFFSCADSDSDNRHPKSKPDFNRERASQKRSEASKKYSSHNRPPPMPTQGKTAGSVQKNICFRLQLFCAENCAENTEKGMKTVQESQSAFSATPSPFS